MCFFLIASVNKKFLGSQVVEDMNIQVIYGETELIIHTDVNDTRIPALYHGGSVNEAFRSQSLCS